MKLVGCIEWLFQAEQPDFVQRVHAARAAGLDGVEFHLWRDKPIHALAEAAAAAGVSISSFCVDPRASLVDPAAHAEVLRAVRDAIPVAQRLGGARMIVASGFNRPGVPALEQQVEAITVLREAARMAADSGTQLLLEPVNMNVGGQPMFVEGIQRGLEIVEAVDSPALRLLADVYHSAVSGETLAEAIGDRARWIGHVQVADTDGRHEPGTGGIDWSAVMALLRRMGYDGDIGLEYFPTMDSAASVAHTRRVLELVV